MEHCPSFKKLQPYLEKKRRITHTTAILYYDLATICPEKGLSDEGDLLDYWSGEYAKLYQDKNFVAIVKEGLSDQKASPMERRLFKSISHAVELLEKMSLDDFVAYKASISKSNEMWRKYRPLDDFKSWLPYWQKMIDLSRKVADLERKPGMKTRYDACLNAYEPGETEEYIDGIFTPLKKTLIDLLQKAKKKQAAYKLPAIKSYPIFKQKELSFRMLNLIRYDLE